MRRSPLVSLVLLASVAGSARAAFIFEIDTDGLDDGPISYNPGFSFGGDTTTASSSITSLAFGCSGADAIFGGDGVNLPDTYLYEYAPDSLADNLVVPIGQDLGEGNVGTGVTGGDAGQYRVYATWGFTENVSGGDTTYEVSTAGDFFSIALDQNGRGDAWIYLGTIDYTSGSIMVTQYCEINSFVSMRAYGLLFEKVPAPASLGLLGLAAAVSRRRRAE